VRSCKKLPLCPIEPVPVPDGSLMDRLVAKAEPIGDGGSTAMTYLRSGEKNPAQL